MKVTSIYANQQSKSMGLLKTTRYIYDVFSELDINVKEINMIQIPEYEFKRGGLADAIVDEIEESDGVVFATTVSLFLPSVSICNLLNYIEQEYPLLLKDKHCFLLVVSDNTGGAYSLNYLSKVISYLKGFDCIRISLNEDTAITIDINIENRNTLEKQTEDFYRYIRQKRNFFISNDYNQTKAEKLVLDNFGLENIELDEKKLSVKHNEDIEEITEFFIKKYTPDKEKNIIYEDKDHFSFDNLNNNPSLKPRDSTVKQLTQTLSHRYKNQLFEGNPFILQLNIDGKENFNCYLDISKDSCLYNEGEFASADVSILANSDIWQSILIGKRSIQKSFMTGQLKVKGNFVLLTLIDKLFSPGNL